MLCSTILWVKTFSGFPVFCELSIFRNLQPHLIWIRLYFLCHFWSVFCWHTLGWSKRTKREKRKIKQACICCCILLKRWNVLRRLRMYLKSFRLLNFFRSLGSEPFLRKQDPREYQLKRVAMYIFLPPLPFQTCGTFIIPLIWIRKLMFLNISNGIHINKTIADLELLSITEVEQTSPNLSVFWAYSNT